jgi:hypothetical protein
MARQRARLALSVAVALDAGWTRLQGWRLLLGAEH